MKKKNIKIRNIILKPDIKINDDQEAASKIVCPMSGWIKSSKAIIDKKRKEITCDKFKLFILVEEIICATTKIKKGFTNSIGWKRKI